MIETLVEIEHREDFSEQGFYSKTYTAFDKRLNRIVAVKDIDAGAIESKESVEHYFEEAQKLAHAAHPRVLPVHFVGLHHDGTANIGSPRIVTRFFEKGSLNKLIETVYAGNRTLSVGRAIRYAHDIIQGMIHLHSLNILHLDLKASNIFIGDDNKLVIADFGQSKMLNDEGGAVVNNLYPSILTPENIRKRVADKTTDIYQFGVLLYSLFNYDTYRDAIDNDYQVNTENLKRVFKSPSSSAEEKETFKANISRLTADIRAGAFPNRDLHHLYVPKVVQDVIKKCLEVSITDRYQNFYDIQSDLSKLEFSDEAQDLYQDLATNVIHFTKEGKSCKIEIETVNHRYNIKAEKNNRAVNAYTKNNLTRIQLAREIEKIANEI